MLPACRSTQQQKPVIIIADQKELFHVKRNIVLVRIPYLFALNVSGRPSPLPSAQASARPSAPVISPPSPHRSAAPDAPNVAVAWPLLAQLRPAARHARFVIPRLFPSQPTKARNFNGLRLLSRGRPSFASKRLARSAQLRAARLLLGSLRARRALHPRRSLCSLHRTLSGARVSVTGPCLRLGHRGSAGGPGLPGALRIAAFLFFLSVCPPLAASLRCASAPASRGRTHLCRLIKREWFPSHQCVLLCVSAAFAGLRPSGADPVSLSRGSLSPQHTPRAKSRSFGRACSPRHGCCSSQPQRSSLAVAAAFALSACRGAALCFARALPPRAPSGFVSPLAVSAVVVQGWWLGAPLGAPAPRSAPAPAVGAVRVRQRAAEKRARLRPAICQYSRIGLFASCAIRSV